jgi:23S rRNA pseudouridine2604 synthase
MSATKPPTIHSTPASEDSSNSAPHDAMRLNKHVAAMIPCSRRDAELYIEGGWVTVNGEIVREPEFAVHAHQVAIREGAKAEAAVPMTFLLHQFPNKADTAPHIAVDNRAADDQSDIHPRRAHFYKLAPSLPLEPHASGLLVFTQDTRVARKLTEDAATIEQEYIVEVKGTLDARGLRELNAGYKHNNKLLPFAKVSWQNETKLRFALKGIVTGQLAYMCDSVGLEVISMKRLRIGRISMGKLPMGQWRYLPVDEKF